MAIQNRRGQYTDFDPTKMVAGELAVVQSGDPNTSDGKAVYVAFQSGTSKRLATYDDIPSGSGTGLTQTEKDLILELFSKAAYAEDDAGTAYEELEQLWSGLETYSVTWSGSGYSKSNSATRVSEGESFTSTVTVNNGFTLDGVTVTMGGSTVTGAWSNGTVTIPSVTGNIVITVATTQVTVSSISAVYTQSGTVYDTDTLDSLKADLVVTATFMDSSTTVINANDYTLSGTLSEGTSTITVTYAGKTDTFTVIVSEAPTNTTAKLDTEHMNKGQSNTFGTYNNKTGFCPTIQYPISTSLQSGSDYIVGIIPVDATSSGTSRIWFYKEDTTGVAGSAYGAGKPMNVYSDSMTEGSIGFAVTAGYVSMTVPVHVDYLADTYLYIQSTGDVLFAGANTPYYGMSNISEAS